MTDIFKVKSYSERNKRKPLQRFLEYLQHAKDCQRGEMKNSILDSYKAKLCKLELCSYVDMVLTHKTLFSCPSSKSCNISSCYSSSRLLLHCKKCSSLDCFVCLFIKGKKSNSVKQADEKVKEETFDDLDTECGVDFKGRSNSTGTCEEARIVEAQAEEILDDSSSKKADCLSKTKMACLPGGMALEKIESELVEETKDSQSVTSVLREKQICGFIRTMIGKINITTIFDKKLLYFFKYITSIEKDVYESGNSKEEYLKTLLGKIHVTNEEFKEYKVKQKHSLVQDAAEFYFKDKIIQMFGSDEVKEIIFPGGVKLKIGEPKTTSGKERKRWQKTITLSDRDNAIFKMCSKATPKPQFFCGELVELFNSSCKLEEDLYEECSSKSLYYDILWYTSSEKYKKSLFKSDIDDKQYLENYTDIIKQFPEKKMDETSGDEAEEKDDLEVNSLLSVFCCSHNLLLAYSVTYQLWKISENLPSSPA